MLRFRVGWLLAGALSLCVLARAEEPNAQPGQIAPPKRIPDVVPDIALEITQPTGEPVTTASVPHAVRQAVAADAARRFQVAVDAVVLASAEQVTWGDGSLGCPEPGRSYTKALVPGYRVTAATTAGRMLYHADTRGNVVTCGLTLRPPKIPDQRPHGTVAEPRAQSPVKSGPDR